MKTQDLRAKIIDKAELKKSPVERQAEALLRRLDADKVVEVELSGTSARTVRRVFHKAASNLGVAISLKTRDDKVYVVLNGVKPQE